ncbi:MAG: hypothetical protein V4635_14240 [Bacteroidota bacterium]
MATSISSINSGGKIRKMIFTSSVISLHKNDTLIFDIDEIGLKWGFDFNFAYDDKKAFTTSFIESLEQKKIEITLHNWDHYDWVEVTKPMELTLKFTDNTSKDYLIKFRTYSSKDMEFRQFDLTIWEA